MRLIIGYFMMIAILLAGLSVFASVSANADAKAADEADKSARPDVKSDISAVDRRQPVTVTSHSI